MEQVQYKCEDCGGRGTDPGSLYEAEVCQECMGSGQVLVEMDPRSHHYGKRKPMMRAVLPPAYNAGDVLEQKWRNGQ